MKASCVFNIWFPSNSRAELVPAVSLMLEADTSCSKQAEPRSSVCS